jgi:hypothetical protein
MPVTVGGLILGAVEAAGVPGAVAFGATELGFGITAAQVIGAGVLLGAPVGKQCELKPDEERE